jgi:hypothetical protein
VQVRNAEEEETVVLAQLIEAGPSPAVALVALFKEALDSRGIPVEQRLRELLVRTCGFWGGFTGFQGLKLQP